jgi:hypothetical protein
MLKTIPSWIYWLIAGAVVVIAAVAAAEYLEAATSLLPGGEGTGER